VIVKRASAVTFILLLISIVPALLLGKGQMVKITINGGGLSAPVETSEPIIGKFTVWAGPGVFVNGVEQTEGFIIDWSKGVVAHRPDGLQQYEVHFYSDFRKREGSVVYAVFYAYDPSTRQGFVYLPGRTDELFKFNTGTMWHGHGLEGNWFNATSEWERFVRPLIAKAKTSHAGD
jgi:hypothetical protein